MEEEYNPCNVPIDIFYSFVISNKRIKDGIKVIKACDRLGEFTENIGLLTRFCYSYEDSLMSKKYNSLIALFKKEENLLYPLYNNIEFWKKKLMYDFFNIREQEKIYNINDFFIDCCENKYIMYIYLLLFKEDEFTFNERLDLTYKANKFMYYISDDYIIVKLLIQDGRFDSSSWENRIIELASRYNWVDIVEILLNDNRVIESDGANIALEATLLRKNVNMKLVNFIVDSGKANFLVPYYDYMIKIAIMNNDLDNVIYYIQKKIEEYPEIDNSHFLIIAAQIGNIEAVKKLLEYQNIIPNNNRIYLETIRSLVNSKRKFPEKNSNYTEILRILLEDGRINPSSIDNEVLNVAIRNNLAEIIELLLDDDRIDPTKIFNRVEIVGDPNVKHPNVKFIPESPIKFAIENGQIELVKLLLDHSKDLSKTIDLLYQWSIENRKTKLVKLLLEKYNLDPSIHSSKIIKTTLDVYTRDIFYMLLDDGRIDPSIDNNYAYKVAIKKGFVNLAKRLSEDPRVKAKL